MHAVFVALSVIIAGACYVIALLMAMDGDY
jgi:hypothetical protein